MVSRAGLWQAQPRSVQVEPTTGSRSWLKPHSQRRTESMGIPIHGRDEEGQVLLCAIESRQLRSAGRTAKPKKWPMNTALRMCRSAQAASSCIPEKPERHLAYGSEVESVLQNGRTGLREPSRTGPLARSRIQHATLPVRKSSSR